MAGAGFAHVFGHADPHSSKWLFAPHTGVPPVHPHEVMQPAASVDTVWVTFSAHVGQVTGSQQLPGKSAIIGLFGSCTRAWQVSAASQRLGHAV